MKGDDDDELVQEIRRCSAICKGMKMIKQLEGDENDQRVEQRSRSSTSSAEMKPSTSSRNMVMIKQFKNDPEDCPILDR
jgi:hypothetical protein